MKSKGLLSILKDGHAASYSEMPYSYDFRVYRIIQKAIKQAWMEIQAEIETTIDDFKNADEDDITVVIQTKLNNMLQSDPPQVNGFTKNIFRPITRGENLCSYDFQHINKQPDLIIRLNSEKYEHSYSPYNGIFIECKPIDSKVNIKAGYIEVGIKRFLEGQYAWAMKNSMMVGYFRYINKTEKDAYNELIKDVSITAYSKLESSGKGILLFETTHKREWLNFSEFKPGQIQIFHLWLSRVSDKS